MVLWMLAVAVSYFVKGLCGFAHTLVLTSILSFGTPNVNISPIDLLLGYPANALLTWENRKNLNPKVIVPLAALVLAGCIPGALLLKNVDVRAIKIVFGVVVVLLGAEMLVREYNQTKLRSSKWLMGIIGIAAGVLCGLFGVGALLAAYISRVTEDGKSFKGNISAVFLAENTFRLILYSFLHILTWNTVKMALVLLPFMLFGLWCGMKSSCRLQEGTVRKIMAVLLVLSGVSLIGMNL